MLDFLTQRAAFRQDANAGAYATMPSKIEEIRILLAKHVGLVLERAQAWSIRDDWLWGPFATGLVAAIYTSVGEILDPELRKLIASGNRDSLKFVVALLRAYNGGLPTLDLCKEVVAALPDRDELLADIRISISSSGATRGEHGAARAHQNRRDEISQWQCDDRPNVKAFADSMLHELDNAIVAETRRADTVIAVRKLGFVPRST